MIQRSPRPGVKQKASQSSASQTLTATTGITQYIPQNRSNHDTQWKVNCLTLKVNTFFGKLVTNIFQKRDYSQNSAPSSTISRRAANQDQ